MVLADTPNVSTLTDRLTIWQLERGVASGHVDVQCCYGCTTDSSEVGYLEYLASYGPLQINKQVNSTVESFRVSTSCMCASVGNPP